MSFRTVTVSSRCKFDLNMGYLEIRADGKKRVRLDEIDTLVIENNAVSVTGCLLSALVENKINVILCDGRRNPQAQVLPFYGCHNCAKRLRDQIAWDVDFKGVVWTAVVCENQRFYYRILSDIREQTEKSCGECVLSVNDTPVPVYKHVELISDLVRFDLNKKTLLTRIADRVAELAAEEKYFLRVSELLARIESLFADLTDEFDLDIEPSLMSFDKLIKAAGFSVVDDAPAVEEKTLAYMKLVRELLGDRLFILPGLRAFIPDEAARAFAETCIAHKYTVLLLEPTDRPRLKSEIRVTIDKDLCEF